MSDLISRNDAISALKALEESAPTAQHVSAIFDCEDIIRVLPSAKPERKKSKWIHKEYFIGACYAECNECHQHTRGIAEDNGFGFNYKFYNFCPNCGADMRGE